MGISFYIRPVDIYTCEFLIRLKVTCRIKRCCPHFDLGFHVSKTEWGITAKHIKALSMENAIEQKNERIIEGAACENGDEDYISLSQEKPFTVKTRNAQHKG